MLTVIQSSDFGEWLDSLRDARAKARILARIKRLELGNPGDWKNVGGPVNEMRIDYGPGYRVYFTRIGSTVILLLAGGDKTSRVADIRRAARILRAFGKG